jgi:cholinesterase
MILFGQSAGGASVDFYAYAYTKDPIVHGFIPQSGSASGRRAASGPPAAAERAAVSTWSKLSQDVGCGPVSETEVTKTLSCMKGKDVSKVLDATQPKTSGAALASWGPKADDLTVMSNIGAERAPKGQFIKAVSNPRFPLSDLMRYAAYPRRQHQQ